MNEEFFETDGLDYMKHKGHVGFVALAGRPNVGKSTLVNQVLGYHLSAVSSRPQTTRKQWRGIYSDDTAQLVFVDTPGIHEPNDRLGETMIQEITRQLKDSDLVLCIADASREQGEEDDMVAKTVAASGVPVVLAVNKVDVATAEQVITAKTFFSERIGDKLIASVEMSAAENSGVKELLEVLKKPLPVMPFMFDPEQLTDAFERDIACELIQEAVFDNLAKEIPHGVIATIDSWKENPKKLKIQSTVHVDRANHKKMVIGKDGVMIERIRRQAIQKLRENIDKMIDLKLYVKVTPGWRDNPRLLNDFGFGREE